jgi:hypothetical protein
MLQINAVWYLWLTSHCIWISRTGEESINIANDTSFFMAIQIIVAWNNKKSKVENNPFITAILVILFIYVCHIWASYNDHTCSSWKIESSAYKVYAFDL